MSDQRHIVEGSGDAVTCSCGLHGSQTKLEAHVAELTLDALITRMFQLSLAGTFTGETLAELGSRNAEVAQILIRLAGHDDRPDGVELPDPATNEFVMVTQDTPETLKARQLWISDGVRWYRAQSILGILAHARRVARMWIDQDGINAAEIDLLAQLVNRADLAAEELR